MNKSTIVCAVFLSVVLPVATSAESGAVAGPDGSVEQNRTTEGNLAENVAGNVAGNLVGRHLKTVLANIGLLPKPQVPKPLVKVSFNYGWVDAQPKAKGDEHWRCLSEALYFEARGETVKGQFAVAEVIMNRVKSSRFPGTLCGVIKQGTGRKYQCQFTYNCDGHKNTIAEHQAFARVSKVARATIDGVAGTGNLTDGATHYHTTAVRPAWARTYKQTVQIGVHLFYRHTYRTAQKR